MKEGLNMRKLSKEEMGQKLKDLRTAAGLTQAQVAKEVGVKQQSVALWENGRSQPDANMLFVLCALYGTTVDRAFGFDDASLNDDEIAIIKKYRACRPESQDAIRLIVNRIATTDALEALPEQDRLKEVVLKDLEAFLDSQDLPATDPAKKKA
jgi:transcriptional regulator with XRE-family HTH domain